MNQSLRKFFSVLCVLSLAVSSVPHAPSVSLPKNLAHKSFVQAKAPGSAPTKLSWWNGVKLIALFSLLCLTPASPIGCVKGGGGSAPQQVSAPIPITAPRLSIKEHADWLVAQIGAATSMNSGSARNLTGLIKSYESSVDPYAHVYNQAQAAMALLVADYQAPGNGYLSKAEAIFSALAANQNADGSFPSAFHLTTPSADLMGKQTGAIAFVGLAVNLYTLKTENMQFVAMGERIANYLVANAIERPGIFPGKAVPNENGAALSLEENLAVYAFLIEFAPISFDQDYLDTALAIRQFLESLWNDPQGWFYLGRNSGLDANGESILNGDFAIIDYNYAADTQFAALALGNSGETNSNFDFTRPINPGNGFSVKSQLETQNSAFPNGIAFDTFSRYNNAPPENWDAAQTPRFSNTLSVVRKRLGITDPASAWYQEAVRQLVNAEALAIISSPGTVGTNSATNVSGTHGGVILTLAPRGDIIPALGPSVEPVAEAIFAKAKLGGFNGVNFYLASEAITQFSSLDKNLIDKINEAQHGSLFIEEVKKSKKSSPASVATIFFSAKKKKYNQCLSQPLGSIQDGSMVSISVDHLKEIWEIVINAFSNRVKNLFPETFGDFVLGVVHHEAVVHPLLKQELTHFRERKIEHFYQIPGVKELVEKFSKRFRIHQSNNKQSEEQDIHNAEEFLAHLISYLTYPQGSISRSFFEDDEIQKLLEKIPKISNGSLNNIHIEQESFEKLAKVVINIFPTVASLLDQKKKINGSMLAERKERVERQIKQINHLITFHNKDELFALVQLEPFEVAL